MYAIASSRRHREGGSPLPKMDGVSRNGDHDLLCLDGGSSNRAGDREAAAQEQKRQRSPEGSVRVGVDESLDRCKLQASVNPLSSSDILIPVLSSRMFTTPQVHPLLDHVLLPPDENIV